GKKGGGEVGAGESGGEGGGQGKSDQDGGEGHRDPQSGRRQQDGQHRQQRAGYERQRRSGGGLDRIGDVGGIDMKFGVQVSGQGATGGQLGSNGVGGGRGKTLGFVQGGQLGQF